MGGELVDRKSRLAGERDNSDIISVEPFGFPLRGGD